MIRFRAGDTNVRVHALALLMLALSFALGARVELAAMLTALFAHEGAHLLAARLLRVRVEALDLMPFGGALTLENPYRMGRWQLMGISLAGPFANLLGLVATAALAWWAVLPPLFALELMRFHLMLAAFNLLPALPLDGGRALFGALQRPRAGVWAGRALACILCALCAAGVIWQRRVNLTFLFCAAYLFASGEKELEQAQGASILSLYGRWQELGSRGALPMRALAVPDTILASQALRHLRTRRVHLLYVFGAGMRLLGTLDEAGLRQWLESDGQPSAGNALKALTERSHGTNAGRDL